MIQKGSIEPFNFSGNGLGLLLLNGFASTPQSVRYVGERVHAACNATVMVPLLKGHGASSAELAGTSHKDWLQSAEDARFELRAHCDVIIAAGPSLGGTLALNLAIRGPSEIDAVLTINGSTGLYSPEQILALHSTETSGYLKGIGSDIKDPSAKEFCYKEVPVSAFRDRYFLTSSTGMMLPPLKQPLLIPQSRTDHVVSPHNATRLSTKAGSKIHFTLQRLTTIKISLQKKSQHLQLDKRARCVDGQIQFCRRQSRLISSAEHEQIYESAAGSGSFRI